MENQERNQEDIRETMLAQVEQIAERLQGMRAALEDVSTDKAKDDVMRGACLHAARQFQAIAEGRAVVVNNELCIFPAKDPGADQ